MEVEFGVAVDVGRNTVVSFRSSVNIVEITTVNVQSDIASDGGHVRTTIDIVNQDQVIGTKDGSGQITLDASHVAAAEEFIDFLWTDPVVAERYVQVACDGALGVASTEKLVDDTTGDGEADTSETDVSSRDFTVTTAEHLIETSTFDVGTYTCGSRCITATEYATNGVVARKYVHQNGLG